MTETESYTPEELLRLWDQFSEKEITNRFSRNFLIDFVDVFSRQDDPTENGTTSRKVLFSLGLISFLASHQSADELKRSISSERCPDELKDLRLSEGVRGYSLKKMIWSEENFMDIKAFNDYLNDFQ